MKKKIVVLFCMIMLNSLFAQKIEISKIDYFEGIAQKATKKYQYGKNESSFLELKAAKIDNVIYLLTYTKFLGCAGTDGNYIKFKFTDGTFKKLTDISKIKCGESASIHEVNPKDFQGKIVEMISIKRSVYADEFYLYRKKYTIQELLEMVE
jgi:hypothetical protein